MDKKVGVSVLFSLILIMSLVFVTKALDDIDTGDDTNDMLRSANISSYGDSFSNDSYIKGGTSEMINVTVTFGGGDANITNITIVIPAGNYSNFDGWLGIDDEFHGSCMADDVDEDATTCVPGESNATFSNVTLGSENGVNFNFTADWSCANLSDVILNCWNNTANSELSSAVNLDEKNVSLMIRFNVTATSSIEDLALWNITVASDDDAGGAVGTNETSLTIFVDGLAPRILEINITDGNVTLFNGTGDGSSALFLNDTNIFTSESDFLVYATVEDLNAAGADDVMWLVYNETDFFTANNANMEREEEENFTSVPGGVGSNANVSEKALVLKGKVLNDWKRYVNNTKNYQTLSALVSWTIPGNLTVDANISEFMFLFNDSYDQGMSQGAGGSDAGAFKVTTNSSVFPTIVNINISDGTNHVVDAALHGGDVNSTYVQASNLTIDFDIDDGKGLLNITVFYNETGNFLQNSEDLISGAPFINGKVTSISNNFTQDDGNSKIANITIHDVNSATRERYQVSFQVDANNNTNTLTFVVVMNGTNLGGVDNPDNSEDQELEEGNYSIIGGPYYVAIDGNAPNVELSTPAQRGITTADSITYKCTGSDGESGVAKYIWYLKKPGSNEFTKIAEKSQSAAHEQSFSGTDIGAPGDYDVKCEVEDVVANKGSATTTSNNQFTVSISSVGAGGTGGGAGGAGAAVSFDVDFTAAPQATFKASQGRVKSFSFDGTTKHTITFNEVTANSVTLVIASDPITVLLNAGQSKSVDVNADGTDDMKVQLNSVDNGVADVTVTKLEEGAAKIKAEEEGARGVTETGEEREVTPVAGKSLAWLWWTLIVIVAIVAIGYYVNKRK